MKIFKRILTLNIVCVGLLLTNIAFAKTACPSQNFNTFIKAFANDESVQKTFVRLPLKSTYRDSRVEGYPFKTDFVRASEIQYPIMLSEYHGQWTLPTAIKRIGRYTYSVRVTADNSTTTLKFQKTKSCWQLNSIYNPAL